MTEKKPTPERLLLVGALFLTVAQTAFAQFDVSAGGSSVGQIYSESPSVAQGLSLSGSARASYTLHLGDIKVRPHLGITAVRDDNLYLSSSDRKSDTYVVITPGVMFLYGDERYNYVYLDYQVGLSPDSDAARETVDEQQLTAFGRYETGRSQYTVWHRYRDVRDVDTAVGARISKVENLSFGGWDYRLSSKTSLGLLLNHGLYDFKDEDYADYRQFEVAGRFYYHVSEKTQVFGQLGLGWVDMLDEADSIGDARYTEVSVGVRGRIRPKIDATGRVGVQFRDFRDPAVPDLTEWMAGLRFDARPYGHLNCWLGLWGDIQPAINAPGFSVVEWRVEPGVSHRLWMEQLVASLSGLWGVAHYRGPASVAVDAGGKPPEAESVFDSRRDTFWGFTVALDWFCHRYASIGGGYSYIRNDSNIEDSPGWTRGDIAAYDGGRWFLRASVNF